MAVRRRRRGGLITHRGPAPPVAQHAYMADRPSASQAKRRPRSGQELRDGVRWDPSNEADPRPEYLWSWGLWSSELCLWPDLHLSATSSLLLVRGQDVDNGPGREP